MAGSIVKWWKSKFLNGYRHISVIVPSDDADAKRSDTEELVPDTGDEAESNPGQTDTSLKEGCFPRKQLSFEEFECDVSVVRGDEGQERQEFSFTLYDFEGHGKVTQDDIAGLVRTIYDAVGSSVRVPPSGSKTIRVKLTVSPDKKETALNNSSSSASAARGYKKDVSVMIQNGTGTGVGGEDMSASSPKDNNRREHRDRLKEKDLNLRGKDCNSAQEKSWRKLNSTRHRDTDPRQVSPELFRQCNSSPARHRRRSDQDRSGRDQDRPVPLQRQELLEIIQFNMEKNNLRFNNLKRHNVGKEQQHCCGDEGRHHYHRHTPGSRHHHHHHHDKGNNNYLDLAGLENHTNPPTAGDKLSRHHRSRKPGHHRSRSHDLSADLSAQLFKYQLLEKDKDKLETSEEKTQCKAPHGRSKSYDAYDYLPSPKVRHIRNKLATGHSTSPHHLKHRHRERDHARAMTQVLNWLEREYPTQPLSGSPSLSPSQSPILEVPVPADKHEHHHVHEHIHHHYHHYHDKDGPVVL